MIKKTLFAISIFSLGSAAFAEESSKYYVEANLGSIKYSQPGFYANPAVGIFKLGVNIDKNFSVEGALGTTIVNADGNVGGIPFTVKYDSIYGVFLKAKTEIASNLDLFARVGYTHATISVTSSLGSVSAGGSDFSYGIGAQYNFTPTVYGQLDYMSYYNKNGATANGPSIGLGLKF